jgi:GAF domain-containing protein
MPLWCSRPAGQHGSTITRTPRAMPLVSPTGGASRASVGVPITVEGRLWGVMNAVSTREQPLPSDAEARLADFTELVATAVANAQARLELRGIAAEQAALRRVATLVARAAPPEQVFAAVTTEVPRLLAVDLTAMGRYDPDGTVTYVGWSTTGDEGAVGACVPLGGRNLVTLVFETAGWRGSTTTAPPPVRRPTSFAGSGSAPESVCRSASRVDCGAP